MEPARSCVGATFLSDFESLHWKGKPSSITSFIIRINKAKRNMFNWMEWIVMTNQPHSIVDFSMTCEAIRYKPITSKLLCKNILALCKGMQTSIKHKLPDKFSIAFDGWSEGSVHCIGLSASYITMVENIEVVLQIVLSTQPHHKVVFGDF